MTGSTPAPKASALPPPRHCVFSAMVKPHIPLGNTPCSGIWGLGINLALSWFAVSAPAWSAVTAAQVWLRGGWQHSGRLGWLCPGYSGLLSVVAGTSVHPGASSGETRAGGL